MLNFGRDAKGKLQEDSSFYTLFYGDKAILLEDELNESQWNQIERLATMNRSQYSSGILNDFTVKSTSEDDIFYIETESPLSVLINGYDLKIGHNFIDNQPVTISSDDNKIIFKLPHETTGFDLVFLEAWFEVMSHDETIRKYGGEATPAIGNFMLDDRVSRETTKRIQFRWRIRSVRNEENLSNVLAHNYNGDETIAKFINQNDVFVANIGVQRDNKNNVKSLGKIYALPLFKVNRSGYVIDTTNIKDIVAKARIKAKMQHKQELEQNMPNLDLAEFGFSTDTEKTFIGGTSGNIELAKQSDVTDLKNNLENYFLNIDGLKAIIQHKRGDEANLPQLAPAEFGFATDTETVFIGGNNNNNIELAKQSDVTDLKNNLENYFVQIDGSNVTITHKQELEQNMPQLEVSELGFAPDTETVFIGGTNGNIELAKQSEVNDLRTYKADKVYVDTEIGKRMMVRHIDTFIATNGQTVFNLTHSYNPLQNRLDVEVGGVPQYTPDNFFETSSTSFTLVEGAPAGVKVVAVYFSEAQPLGTDLEKVVNGLINTKVDKDKLMIRYQDKFIATEGQTVFNLSESYDILQNRLDVEVDGVPQDSPSNFIETSSTSFTLTEGVPAGTIVIADYFNAAYPLGNSGVETLVNKHATVLVEHENKLVEVQNRIADLQNNKTDKTYVDTHMEELENELGNITTLINELKTSITNELNKLKKPVVKRNEQGQVDYEIVGQSSQQSEYVYPTNSTRYQFDFTFNEIVVDLKDTRFMRLQFEAKGFHVSNIYSHASDYDITELIDETGTVIMPINFKIESSGTDYTLFSFPIEVPDDMKTKPLKLRLRVRYNRQDTSNNVTSGHLGIRNFQIYKNAIED